MERIIHEGKPGVFIPENEMLLLGYKFESFSHPPQNSPQLLHLKFFTTFNTVQKQEALRKAIMSILTRIDVNAGRDWIVVYIAYVYITGRLVLLKNYTDFFIDIDSLLPGTLTKINHNEPTNSERFKKYVQSLTKECSKWFIHNNCLPPLNVWTSRQHAYQVKDDRRNKFQMLVNEVLKFLQTIQ